MGVGDGFYAYSFRVSLHATTLATRLSSERRRPSRKCRRNRDLYRTHARARYVIRQWYFFSLFFFLSCLVNFRQTSVWHFVRAYIGINISSAACRILYFLFSLFSLFRAAARAFALRIQFFRGSYTRIFGSHRLPVSCIRNAPTKIFCNSYISHLKSISTAFCLRDAVLIVANNRAVFCKKKREKKNRKRKKKTVYCFANVTFTASSRMLVNCI